MIKKIAMNISGLHTMESYRGELYFSKLHIEIVTGTYLRIKKKTDLKRRETCGSIIILMTRALILYNKKGESHA